MPTSERAALQGPDGRRRRMLVLVICSSSLIMTYLDTTILNVALPTIQAHLHASLAGLQWVVDAYLLVLASLLLLAGSVADRLGRRRLFCTGLLTFSAGSLLCSVAPNIDSLIAFRAVQAIGGSMLTPVSLSILRHTFEDSRERAHAIGLWSGTFGLAAACGPVLGGVLVEFVGWRSVFWVNVPVGVGAFVLARRYLPESRSSHRRGIDPLGQALMVVLLASLTYAIIQGAADGWGSPAIVSLLVLSGAAGVAFVLAEQHHPEPLLDLRFFRSPPFSGATAIAGLSFVLFSGFLFVNTLYLQEVRGDSALAAGLSTLPTTVTIVFSAPLAGWLVARGGARVVTIVSGLLLAAGCVLLLGLSPSTPFVELAVPYLLLGLGFGMVGPPITAISVVGMPPDQAGVASAVASTSRQVGNVLGVAVMGAMLTAGFRARLPGQLAPLGLSAPLRASLRHIGVGGGTISLPGPARHDPAVLSAIDRAFTSATHAPWVLGALCGLACAAVAFLTTTARANAVARAVARADQASMTSSTSEPGG